MGASKSLQRGRSQASLVCPAQEKESECTPLTPHQARIDLRLELSRVTINFTEMATERSSRASRPTAFVQGSASIPRQKSYSDRLPEIRGNFRVTDLSSLGIGIACKKGLKPKTPNQDDYSIMLGPIHSTFGVFDGHGCDGHHISHFIKSKIPRLISKLSAVTSSTDELLKKSFELTHSKLIDHCSIAGYDCELSGATATVAYLTDTTLTLAHVGDSRAVLGLRSNTRHTAQRLTQDHKPQLAQERTRIYESGGEVRRPAGDMAYRVFKKDQDEPGLSVSRALGDTMAWAVGVTPTPDITSVELTESAEYLILCSDGVWEFINDQEAVDLVSRYGTNCKKAAKRLARTAWNRWIREEGDMADDITALVLYLPWLQPKPKV